ncbi:MAG: hypothetical protein L0387_02365 [Acidobacteria bacterium]|nr:hypothetical protein [Acidobacteriota bacterium]
MTTLDRQQLDCIEEPRLAFGKGQVLESPKDGLFLFGPLEEIPHVSALRIGVIGTKDGLKHFRTWVDRIQGFIPALESESAQHQPFPGFAAVYGTEFPAAPVCELSVMEDDIDSALLIADRHLAIYRTVELFSSQIARYLTEEEVPIDVWFVVIPERIYTFGRPRSVVPVALRIASVPKSDKKLAKRLLTEPSLFEEDHQAAEPYYYAVNFHNQLKARLLEGKLRAVVQMVRDTALVPEAFLRDNGTPLRRIQDPATIAWNLCTTAFFKSGRRPWRLAEVRERVCYIGLVFKQVLNASSENAACCGAQMFLDSGDGLVFKGAVGPWRTDKVGEYHLSRESAKALISMVVEAYASKHGYYPAELFIHAKTTFSDQEWDGFGSAVPSATPLVGVRIRSTNGLKLFRLGTHPVLRGTAMYQNERSGYLWTRGFIPYLNTYPGRESPNPLKIDVIRGEADLRTVMGDVMSLTKLNFNACIYGDGLPVTLRFADSVGEILTAGPAGGDQPPLPFKHYI